MPITVHCRCGATFDLPDRYAGRQGHCFDCGAAVNVPDPLGQNTGDIPLADVGTIPFAEDDPPRPPVVDDSPSLHRSWSEPVPEPAPPAQAEDAASPRSRSAERDVILEPEQGFWPDALRSFTIIFEGDNLFPCMAAWFLLVISGSLSFIMSISPVALLLWMLQMIIWGWLAGFYINIILETARGENRLPQITSDGSVLDDIFGPLLTFAASWMAVLSPAILVNVLARWYPVFGNPILSLVLIVLGVFLWPATILTLAVGGGVRGLRPDLIVMTVARAIGPYLAIWLMLSVAGGLLVLPGIAEEYGLFDAVPVLGGGRSWPAHVLISVFSGYLLIVIMRTIGLFYRHFKADFAWSAE